MIYVDKTSEIAPHKLKLFYHWILLSTTNVSNHKLLQYKKYRSIGGDQLELMLRPEVLEWLNEHYPKAYMIDNPKGEQEHWIDLMFRDKSAAMHFKLVWA